MAAPDRRYVARRCDRTSVLAWTGVAVLAVILLVAVGALVWTTRDDGSRPGSSPTAAGEASPGSSGTPMPGGETVHHADAAGAAGAAGSGTGSGTGSGSGSGVNGGSGFGAGGAAGTGANGAGAGSAGASAGTGGATSPRNDAGEAARGPSSSNETGGRWTPASPLPDDFIATAANPSVDDLNAIIWFLVATDAPSSAKARNIETEQAIVVPDTVSRIGLFRAPRGGFRVSGPVRGGGDRITAHLDAFSQGTPEVSLDVDFVRVGGNWRLADSSMCNGVRAVGLPIYCNA